MVSKRKPRPTDYMWRMTDHICRACFGRVLMREGFDGQTVYRCSNCGVERDGVDERVICCCGLKLRTTVDAGIRCRVNENRSPEFPSEIVAVQVDPPQ